VDAAATAARGPAAGGTIVVVQGKFGGTEPDAASARRAQRRQRARRLRSAALAAAAAQLPLAGAILLAQGALALLLIGATTPLAATVPWVTATATTALLMLAWPRRTHRRESAVEIHALAALGAAAALWPIGWADPAQRPLLALIASLLGVVGTAALAPLPGAWMLALLLPPAACAAVAVGSGDWVWLAAGGLGAGAAWALGRQRHLAWTQQTQALIDQADRLRTLERECQDAQSANQDKSRFLAIASHDLRQPVHALGLFAATLQRRLRQSPDEPLARNLMRAVDGLERSFNAMLDISRLDGGALTPQLQTFPLRDMFRRLQMHYGGQAELSGLGLRFSPGGKSVTSDPQLLERIVGNLVQNAIKYTAHGGIVVVARTTATHVNVEVWDTGCGISADELPRIFEEFYQVGRGERDRTHGLGMGLAIVKRLAALLGHRLEVASKPGRGTMFRVGMPIGGLPGIQEDLAPADTVPMQVHAPQMVLVIDDEEPIREGLQLLLQEWGYQAITAADGLQAEQAVSALDGRVDLVLSDLHLGDGPDGQDVIASVRRLCGRELPAILITGETAAAEVQRIAASGDPVLFKPVQPRRLFEAIRDALA
jgi:signal transduction histidine kinase